MTVTIITVGSLKESYLKEAISEYKKRLSQYARVDEIELKEERITNEDDRASIARALDQEALKILSAIPDGAYKIALCVEGKQYSSEELAVALSILNDAEIPYLTKDRGAGGAAKIIMGFNMYGTDIYVLKQQLEEAKAIFESAQFVEEEEETND